MSKSKSPRHNIISQNRDSTTKWIYLFFFFLIKKNKQKKSHLSSIIYLIPNAAFYFSSQTNKPVLFILLVENFRILFDQGRSHLFPIMRSCLSGKVLNLAQKLLISMQKNLTNFAKKNTPLFRAQ